MTRPRWRLPALLALLLATASAYAHDTWFESRAGASVRMPGLVLLLLGTGNLFPVHEVGVDPGALRVRGCRQGDRTLALDAASALPKALALRVLTAADEPLSCWAELQPFEVTLAPALIPVYLDEIQASPAVRAAWAALAARGLPWKERYIKNARIEVAGSGAAASRAQPAPIGLDIVLASGLAAIRAGDAIEFQLLRDGTPLAGQPLELRGADPAAPARWFVTDGDGRIRTTAPAPGRWSLRGTDLRLAEPARDSWDSRFVNLAFDVRAPR